jgi:hypothetical protein
MDLSGKIIKGTGSFDVKEIAPPTLSGQLIENPNFENWTSDTPDDWNIVQDATNYITEDQDGGCRVVRVNGSVYLYQGGITEDKYFKAVLTVSKFGTGGSCALGDGSTPYLVLTSANAVGVHTVYFRSISTFDRIYLTFSNGTDITINSLTVEEVPEGYPLLDKGDKYLECTSNGTVAIPSTQAYGEWEWSWYKGSNGGSPAVAFINDRIAPYDDFLGYTIYMFSTNKDVRLYKCNNGSANNIMNTVSSYIANETWYRMKLIRVLDGTLSMFIRGGSFGNNDWTLIAENSGDNPVTDNTYTESKYFVLDLDAGDRFANLEMRNIVRQ